MRDIVRDIEGYSEGKKVRDIEGPATILHSSIESNGDQ